MSKYLEVKFVKGISKLPYKMLFPINFKIIGFGGYTTEYQLKDSGTHPIPYLHSIEHLLIKYTLHNDGLQVICPFNVIDGEPFESSFTKFKIQPYILNTKGEWMLEKSPEIHFGGLPITTLYPIHNTVCDVYKMIR